MATDAERLTPFQSSARTQIEFHDYLWSYIVMKQVRIAELKAKLSEFLRTVQRGNHWRFLIGIRR